MLTLSEKGGSGGQANADKDDNRGRWGLDYADVIQQASSNVCALLKAFYLMTMLSQIEKSTSNLQEQDQKLNSNALVGQEDNRPKGVNVQGRS